MCFRESCVQLQVDPSALSAASFQFCQWSQWKVGQSSTKCSGKVLKETSYTCFSKNVCVFSGLCLKRPRILVVKNRQICTSDISCFVIHDKNFHIM